MFLASAFAIFLWYNHAIAYNTFHDSVYFSTRTWPLWDLTDVQIDSIIQKVKQIWLQEYWHISVVYIVGLLLVIALWKSRHFNAFFSYMVITMTIGVVAYVLLWFMAFGNHDYYIIDILVWCLFILVAFLDYVRKNHTRWFHSVGLKLLFLSLLLININYANKRTQSRYTGWMNNMGNITALNGMESYLGEIGVGKKR